MVGAVIMAHGDDQGLVLPPRLAPTQVVIVPIWRKDAEKSAVLALAAQVTATLKAAGIRVKLDDREEVSAGFKFNDWEMRGVPLRIEIGPRDVEQNAVVFARRDVPGKEGKTFGVPVAQIAQAASDMLTTIQAAMLQRATEFREAEHAHGQGLRRVQAGVGRAGRLHPGALGRQQRGRGRHQGRDEGDHPLLSVRHAGRAKGSASTPASGRAAWQSSRGRISSSDTDEHRFRGFFICVHLCFICVPAVNLGRATV